MVSVDQESPNTKPDVGCKRRIRRIIYTTDVAVLAIAAKGVRSKRDKVERMVGALGTLSPLLW